MRGTAPFTSFRSMLLVLVKVEGPLDVHPGRRVDGGGHAHNRFAAGRSQDWMLT